MKLLNFAALLLVPVTLAAAEVTDVKVRQLWPWSTNVRVSFTLADIETPVDVVSITATNGGEALDGARILEVARGELYLLGNGEHSFTFDPVKAFGAARRELPEFKLQLGVAATSVVDGEEVLYRVYDLTTFARTDITRKELLNYKYGEYETDFSKLDAENRSYWTSLENVLIWTGVTNYPGARTTKLVMRKIPAAGKTYSAGAIPNADDGSFITTQAGNPTVALAKNFWIGVFEITERQYSLLTAKDGAVGSAPTSLGDGYAAGKLCYKTLRGDPTEWGTGYPADPNTVTPTSMIQLMRDNLGAKVDLPAEYQWEYAARAGTTNATYVGRGATSGSDAQNIERKIAWNSDFTNSLQIVGQLRPNAFGLYDIIGNANELCRDRMPDGDPSLVYTGDLEDPEGPTDLSYEWAMFRGGGCDRGTKDASVLRRRLLVRTKYTSEFIGMRLWMPGD